VIGILLVLLIVGGSIFFLQTQKVTIAILTGQVSYGGGTSITIQQVGFSHLLNLEVRNISRLEYFMTKRGTPRVTESRPVQLPNVVNLTIKFKLITPTNTALAFEPLKIGKGGTHNFELVIGPAEGLTSPGTFHLIIEFHLIVTTPTGTKVVDIQRTIEITFTVPKGTVSMREIAQS